ncbi:MAG TPA: type II secretion system F family protein [Thermodesulfobacteriota bacterium]|nr:type II secretion system F family protein [Thermodesulfobacteriota bacterium]
MAVFSYRGTDMQGLISEGAIEAPDEQAAIERLKNSGIIPLKIFLPGKGLKGTFSLRSSKGDILSFTNELAALLEAGLPLDRSLNILGSIAESKQNQAVIQDILKSIREGGSFSDALLKHPKVFSRLYVNMIKAGEAGGILVEVLEKLNEFLESTKELKEQVLTSMIYPIILLSTGGLSIMILLTYVLPKFSVIFSDLGSSLPLSTQILLALSEGLKSYWWIFLAALVFIVFLFRVYIKSDSGRFHWDRLKLLLLGDIIRKLETARFCRTLGTLLKSGVPLLQALNNARDVVTNQVIASSLLEISQGIKEGRGISQPLSKSSFFPPLALSMIKVGEETGQLDKMLMQVALTYEKNLRVTIKRFVGFLEPAMILGMGLVIGFIVLSMLMAIFSMTELPF